MSKKRSYLILSSTALLLVIVATLTLFYTDGIPFLTDRPADQQIAFDRSEWKRGDERERAKMIDDLIDRSILIGKDREEVTAILGPPDKQGDTLIAYTVDLGQRFWFGSPWYYDLYVSFDSTGTVQTVGYTD